VAFRLGISSGQGPKGTKEGLNVEGPKLGEGEVAWDIFRKLIREEKSDLKAVRDSTPH